MGSLTGLLALEENQQISLDGSKSCYRPVAAGDKCCVKIVEFAGGTMSTAIEGVPDSSITILPPYNIF